MSLRKNQLKKMTLQEIMTRLLAETDSDNIKLINSYICEKNALLTEKKQAFIEHIETTRKKIQKDVHSLNYNIKDRVERKEKILMDKDSRPTTEDMTALMELYTYMENQGAIMDQNIDYVQQLTASVRCNFDNLTSVLGSRANNQHLDLQYQELHRRCEEQERIRNQLLCQRNEKRNHYANIIQTIEDCRVEYEAVEGRIRDTERELIRITTYYDARLAEDKAALVQLPRQAVEYQMELLSAQSRLNKCELSYQERLMREIEVESGING